MTNQEIAAVFEQIAENFVQILPFQGHHGLAIARHIEAAFLVQARHRPFHAGDAIPHVGPRLPRRPRRYPSAHISRDRI